MYCSLVQLCPTLLKQVIEPYNCIDINTVYTAGFRADTAFKMLVSFSFLSALYVP